MLFSLPAHLPLSRARIAAVLALALALPGCAEMSDSMSLAFADPAKYDLYDCKQLEAERKRLGDRTAELQGLMAKAETGAGGAVVAEVAYRNEYIATRGQSKLAEQAWQKNRCRETVPGAAMPVAPPAALPAPPSRAGRSVY
ncbi:twin-arginine translocation pathway signal [Bradyrhizobium sp.]|uniref:twin-arginine translocation pathway signal n=1 Tax=Bradyrhizobium sp. TaxID=376 RepID=UPI001D867F1F|nr:twin-arginine translocation pathway signal [Bradyrhizobium sp.]MBI5323436.1 twin-arginine translocation pathway signal [Bradyrhizobium sp.]